MTRQDLVRVQKVYKRKIVKDVISTGFQDSHRRLAASATKLQGIIEGDMQINLLRNPLQPIVLDRWRNSLMEVVRAVMGESASVHKFQKRLAQTAKGE